MESKMKLPKDRKYILEMLKYDPEKALDMAYEAGFNEGKITELKELVKVQKEKDERKN